MTRPSYHTRHARRALNLAAQMCIAQYAGESPTPGDLARLYCALVEGNAGFSPDQVWLWPEAECKARIEYRIAAGNPAQIERKGAG